MDVMNKNPSEFINYMYPLQLAHGGSLRVRPCGVRGVRKQKTSTTSLNTTSFTVQSTIKLYYIDMNYG